MSTNPIREQFSLPEIIDRSLRSLRRVLRFYVFFDGFIIAAFYTCLILAADFLLDRFFQFSLSVRGAVLTIIIFAVIYILWRRLLSRFFASIKSGQLAYLFERYVPDLKESLVTVVEASEIKYRENEIAPEFLQEALTKASDKLHGINVQKFFRSGQLWLRFFGMVLIFGAIIFLCVKYSETAEIWFSRNVLLSNREWPRRSLIIVDGFTDGHIRIRRGDSFTMSIRADMKMPLVPDTIRLHVGSDESGYRTILVDQFRVDTIENSEWRIFSYTFAEMLETVNVRINAADSTIDGLRIEVVPPPILADIKLLQKFPAYMQRDERTITPGIRTVIPDGASIELTVTSSKPLLNAKVVLNNNEPSIVREEKIESAFTKFAFALEKLREDTKIGFLFLDTDNLRNKQSIRFELNILKDQPPTVTARFDGIGAMITPNAVLPTVGEITDDNGIANSIYRYKIIPRPKEEEKEKEKDGNKNDQNKTVRNDSHVKLRRDEASSFIRFDLDSLSSMIETDKKDKTETESKSESKIESKSETKAETETNAETKKESSAAIKEGTSAILGIGNAQTLFTLNTEFRVEELNLQSGDKLSLRIEAMDKFDLDLPQTFQVGFGPDWELEIVTPERLKLTLEAREISFRQHFETLIGEVELTKRLIGVENYPLTPPDSLVKEVEAMKIPDDTKEEEKEKKQLELDAKKKELLNIISKDQAVFGQYNISRALRDTQKEVYELRTIVDSFKTIRKEMVNNKIFNSDSESRIDGGIISPISVLAERDFPDLDRMIGAFEKTLAIRDKPLRQDAIDKRKIVMDQFDVILKKMESIRDNMVSMESFNEIIEILREILKGQRQIQTETEDLHKKQIKELLLKE
ncbi:MAG: hypothetical protein LBB88_12305 [Planctomycetaceae bacterium]|jgi:hypothetical protein|nr:hypothetical protein [Planctomycetaceae bacterium]